MNNDQAYRLTSRILKAFNKKPSDDIAGRMNSIFYPLSYSDGECLVNWVLDNCKFCPTPAEIRKGVFDLRLESEKFINGNKCPKCNGDGLVVATNVTNEKAYSFRCPDGCGDEYHKTITKLDSYNQQFYIPNWD